VLVSLEASYGIRLSLTVAALRFSLGIGLS